MKKFFLGSIALAAIFISFVAQAYVYPSSFAITNWLEKVKGVKTLHVRQQTTIYDSKLPGGAVVVDEEIWIRRPSEYRRTATYPNGKFDVIVGKDRTVRIWAGKTDPLPLVEALGPLGGLYVYADRGRLSGFLRQMGADLTQTHWVLRNRQIGLAMGDPKGVRVTLSKQDSSLMSAEVGEKSYRFDSGMLGRFPVRYPSVVEVWVGGRLAERTDVKSVETDVRVDESRFEIPHVRTNAGKK